MARLSREIKFHTLTNADGLVILTGEITALASCEVVLKVKGIKKGQSVTGLSFNQNGWYSRISHLGNSSTYFEISFTVPNQPNQLLGLALEKQQVGIPVDIRIDQWAADGTIFAHGGCVSRDTFELSVAPPLAEYRARSSLVAAFDAERPSVSDADLERNSSAFQRRMLETEIKRQLPALLKDTPFDLLLIDLIVERTQLGVVNGALVTRSPEFIRTGLDSLLEGTFDIDSDQYFSRFQQSWSELCELLGEARIVVNRVFWASYFNDGTRTSRKSAIDKQNSRLEKLYAYIEHTSPGVNWITYSNDTFVADKNHKWGKAPYHFGYPFYYAQARMLTELIKEKQSAPHPRAQISDNSSLDRRIVLFRGRAQLYRSVEFQFLRDLSSFGLGIVSFMDSLVERKNALVSFALVLADGTPVPSDSDIPGLVYSHSQAVGWYAYLRGVPGTVSWYKHITLPDGVYCRAIRIMRWGKDESRIELKRAYVDLL